MPPPPEELRLVEVSAEWAVVSFRHNNNTGATADQVGIILVPFVIYHEYYISFFFDLDVISISFSSQNNDVSRSFCCRKGIADFLIEH